MPLHRTGLLIIRAWLEKASSKPLRVHIRSTTNASKGFESKATVTDVPATTAAVEKWLDDVVAAGGPGTEEKQPANQPR